MNKIYKVIWSKVRNCYIAVSEIAKRNGKSCTSVNCGAKANRRYVTLALAIATLCAVPVNAMAANSGGTTDSEGNYVGDSPNYDVKIDSGHSGGIYGRKESGSTDAANAKVTITAGTVTGNVYGGYNDRGTTSTYTYANATGNFISISGGTVNGYIYGGYSSRGKSDLLSNASNNTITISGTATIKGSITGGSASTGNTSGNTITITGGTFDIGTITGGFASSLSYGDSCNNTITLAGGDFTNSGSFSIYAASDHGGRDDENTVNLYGNVKGLTGASLYGVSSLTSTQKNNELHIGGTRSGAAVGGITLAPWTGTTGNKVAKIYRFNNIVLHKVNWDTTTPVLAAGQFIDNFTNEGYLDISGMTFTGTPNYGEMALLSSDISNDFKTLKVKYNSGDPVTLNSENLKLIRQSGTQKTESAFQNGVKLTYKEKEHTVSLKNSYRSVVYSIADNVTGVTFDSMTWGTGRTLETGHHFAFEGAAINASNLTFLEKEYSFGNTTGIISTSTTSTTSSEMTLLANATGITSGNSVTQPSSGKGTVPIKYVDGSFTINATASGTVSAASDSAKYTVNSVKVDKVTLGENTWGLSSGLGSMWGWETSSSTNIDATGLTYRKRTSGSYAAIRVNDTSDILGASGLSLATVTKPTANDGKVTVPLEVYETTTPTNPITYNATAYGDVIVESDTIKTKITSVALDKVTLGSFAWGYPRTMPDTWTASASTKIDDTNFAYAGTASTALKKNDTQVILNATGLTTGSSVIRDSGASATKTVGMNFTDNGTGGSGFNFVGTAKGHVEAAADKVNYVVDSVTLNNINLAAWTGTAYNIASADNWVLSTGTDNKVNATIDTSNFALPTGMTLATGEKKVIITADDSSYFENIKFTGNNIWNGNPEGSSLDTTAVNGVSVTGSQTKGGIKVDDTNKNQIIYEETKKRVTGITLGEAIFAKDNGSEIAGRTFDSSYDATDATITTEGLAFTNSSVMEAGDSMTILNASNAIKDGSNHALPVFTTQKTSFVVGFTDEVTDKGLTFKGTHTDTLSNDQTKMVYTVGNKVVSGDDAAALTGSITWNDSTPHYTNTKYTFDSTSKTNLSGLTFGTVTTDPYGKSMTLISGNMAGTVSNAPASFGVSLEKTNTTLEATAAGSAVIDSGDLKYTVNAVNGVTIDKINVKQVTDTAEVLPTGWVLKKSGSTIAATVETGTGSTAMTPPSGLTPGETKVILTAGESLEGITINGDFKWQENGSSLPTTAENGVAITGTQTAGGVKVNEANTNQLVYEETKKSVTGITLGEVTFAKDGTARAFDNTYDATGATINGDNLKFTEASAASMETGDTMTILDASAAVKSGGAALVAFADKSYTVAFSETNTDQNVTIAGTHSDTLSQDAAKTKLTYTVGTKDVNTVALGKVDFVKGSTLFDRSGAGYNYAGVTALGTDGFAVSYASPETVATGDSMTLLKANATLKDMAEQVKKTSYSYTPVTGVTIDANITGKLAVNGGVVTFTAAENQAGKLTFTNVDWKDSGALMTRPKNITFSGADVDTAKINFTNITLLDANKQMTLVSDFGDKVGTITGTKYMVGTTSEGEGVASLSGSDLIFTTKTGAGGAAEQTHRTVMATEAGIAALAAGQEYVDSAVEGLGMLTNLSSDGTSTFAAMGGGASRYKTGSHVDTRTWNAVVAVGSKREHKKGTFEWGVFAEYGKGNYTLHSDDGGRGDGDTHYAGGGLLAKWTNKHKVYTEASVRMGRISDSASNMLRDGAGNQYGYNVHANYYGGHIGIGKLFEVKKNRELDVYGKFFYTRRNGVSFNAAGRYDLDAVNSSLLRVGARYGSTDKKWNWYGGLAYEYQFDGESGGVLNGNTPIRAASIKGGSVRGEIGLRMDATETNPWKVDFSIYGYGGKHRGIGGSVNVAYMF